MPNRLVWQGGPMLILRMSGKAYRTQSRGNAPVTRGRLLRAISVSQALSWFAGVGTLAVNRASPHGRDEISPRRAGVKVSSVSGRLLAHKIGGFIYCGDPRKLAPSIFFPINGPARQIRYSLGLSLASVNCVEDHSTAGA